MIKSERAKMCLRLEMNLSEPEQKVIEKAIGLAEADARERASLAFCRGCVHRPFSCRNGYNNMCQAKETFLNNYDHE